MNQAKDINKSIVESYLKLLNNLTPDSKLDLISKLSSSIKSDIINKKSTLKKSFGAFKSKQTAEEIIEDIRSSRVFNRKIESL